MPAEAEDAATRRHRRRWLAGLGFLVLVWAVWHGWTIATAFSTWTPGEVVVAPGAAK